MQNQPIRIQGDLILSDDGTVNTISAMNVTGNISVGGVSTFRVRGGEVFTPYFIVGDTALYIIAIDSMAPPTANVRNAVLDGEMELDFDPLFLPTLDIPITVLKFQAKTGVFDEVIEPTRSLFEYKVTYTETTIDITATEPGQISESVTSQLSVLFLVMVLLQLVM